jgi:hypothetical protein
MPPDSIRWEASPAQIVIGAVAVVFAVGLIVLVVVRDEIVEREPIMAGHEIDALLGLALLMTVYVGAAQDACGHGSFLERHGDIHRFVKGLIRFHQLRDVEEAALSLNQLLRRARIEWHGVALKRPDWRDHSHSLAFTGLVAVVLDHHFRAHDRARSPVVGVEALQQRQRGDGRRLRTLRGRFLLHGILNAYWEPLTFELPPVSAEHRQGWRRCIDTALDSPDDICPWECAPVINQETYEAQPRSVVLLVTALETSPETVRESE